MTESNGVFTLTKYSVELSTSFVTDAGLESETPGYGYKVAADGKWGVKEFPASGNQFLSPDADGVYNVVFTWNPATEELTATLTAATGPLNGILLIDTASDDPSIAVSSGELS